MQCSFPLKAALPLAESLATNEPAFSLAKALYQHHVTLVRQGSEIYFVKKKLWSHNWDFVKIIIAIIFIIMMQSCHIFCTCYHNSAVMACVKVWDDLIIIFLSKSNIYFQRNSHIWQSLSLRDWRWKAAVTLGWMGATFSGSGSWPPRGTAIVTRPMRI